MELDRPLPGVSLASNGTVVQQLSIHNAGNATLEVSCAEASHLCLALTEGSEALVAMPSLQGIMYH